MVNQNQISKLKRVSEVLISIFLRPSGMIGFSIVILHIIIAIISPLIVPYDYKEINSLIMLRPQVKSLFLERINLAVMFSLEHLWVEELLY